jgi:pyruvate/2-oxoacid:ferredoxin oxidoreductase alpha subunit
MEAKYIRAQQVERRWEEYRTADAELIVVGYGIVSRVLRSAVDEARKQGIKVGLFRPISLWPFPSTELLTAALRAEKVLVVELSNGQMVEDVRLALDGKRPVEFYGRGGGNVPAVDELIAKMEEQVSEAV